MVHKENLCDILHFGYPLREVDTQWEFVSRQNHSVSLPQLKQCLLDVCSRRLGNDTDVVLPLSGGLDSRLVLACLLELLPPKRIHAFNYGTPGQLDFDIPPFIAKSVGIHFTQVSYDEITIAPDDIRSVGYSIHSTPAHNLVGYMVTQKASQLALRRLGVDNTLPVWSGFLGDRVFFGKWSGDSTDLKKACDVFCSTYSMNRNPAIALPKGYNPAQRLQCLFSKTKKPEMLTWLEFLDMTQRQFRVRFTLQTLDNPYCFLFEDSQVLQAIFSINTDERKNGKLQREYFHAHHPKLSAMPVTSRFGYPLRKLVLTEKLDRYKRLFFHRLDNILGTRLETYKRKKVTVESLKRQIPGYREVLDQGINLTMSKLSDAGIELSDMKMNHILGQRSRCELMASLGYLCASVSAMSQRRS